jgi:hypothetical protein
MKQFENKRIEFLNSLITEFENSDELYHENGISSISLNPVIFAISICFREILKQLQPKLFGDSTEFDKIQGIFSHFISIVKDFKIRSQYIETDTLDGMIGSSMIVEEKEIKIVSNYFEKDLKLNESVNVKKMNEIITNIHQYKWSPMISKNFVRFAFEPNYL